MNIKRPDLYRTEQFNKWFNNLKDHVAKKCYSYTINAHGIRPFWRLQEDREHL